MAFRNRSADVSRFSMVPRSDVPRSVFQAEKTLKTTFDAGLLIPIYVDEILPGDSVKLRLTAFVRMATPILPLMDNLHLDTFFFFVPMRLVWPNSARFFGERTAPAQSDMYLIPELESGFGGFPVGSLGDYFGLPTVGQANGSFKIKVNSLPFRAYNLIFREWFRDENIASANDPIVFDTANPDGPDTAIYNPNVVGQLGSIFRRGKRHDYFTSCLPWPEKPQSLDMTQGFAFRGGAPVTGLGAATLSTIVGGANVYEAGTPGITVYGPSKDLFDTASTDNRVYMRVDSDGYPDVRVTINNLRTGIAVQNLLERNARGGTRYTELVRSHFGVMSPDARLQRPEYLGGGSTPISVSPIVQTSATKAAGETAGGATPLGQLGGVGTGVAHGHGFSQSFTEHGYIIGIASVRADLTYQQGLHKMWSRRTRFDFYWPAFANLGEQPVLRKEIYCTGDPGNDDYVFGYQERWAEYRHKPNQITGLFRSTSAGTLDVWHLAQKFSAAPTLSEAFIQDDPPVDRVIAVPSEPHFLFDGLFSVRHVRPLPAFSVPGLGARF